MKTGDVIVSLVGLLLATVGIIAVVDIVRPGTIKINMINLLKVTGVTLAVIMVVLGLAMVFAVATGRKFWEQD